MIVYLKRGSPKASDKGCCCAPLLCPYDRDSGKFRGKRAIWGGRSGLRATLYMAMLSAVRYYPQIKDCYTSLIARGKPKKVAITACIRKFITILNAMFRDQKGWIYS
ncbi:transposase [Pantoea cypripedii]|uniref:transposase n=1 Tax=Pantoea cypripedii TaxID=55209 RepID=UPI001ABF0647|nr:transposase [Pantoea cypripedii]